MAASIRTLVTTLFLATCAYFLAATLPWFALPLCWVFIGASYVGLSAIVQDCAQGTFSASAAVNRIVGTVLALPLFVPFASPVWNFEPSSIVARLAQGPAWMFSAVVELFAARGPRTVSWYLGVALQWTVAILLLRAWGFAAFVKYWLVPWGVYLIWRSFFLHDAFRPAITVPVPFTSTEVQIELTVNKYPRWLRLLTNDVASVLSATRLLRSYVRDYARQQFPVVPSTTASQLLNYLLPAAVTDAALAEEREKLRIAALERECEQLRSQIDFGTPLESVETMLRSKFAREGRANKWVLCDGLIFDISKFYTSHPGGEAILEPFYGRDITRAFNGGVYNHSNAARNLSRHFIIARIVDDVEVPTDPDPEEPASS